MPLIINIIFIVCILAIVTSIVSIILDTAKISNPIVSGLGMILFAVVIWLLGAFFFATKNVTVHTPVNVNHKGVAIYSTTNNNSRYTFNIKGHDEYNKIAFSKVVYNASNKSYIKSTTKKTTVFPGVVITSKNFSPVAYLRTK